MIPMSFIDIDISLDLISRFENRWIMMLVVFTNIKMIIPEHEGF